MWYTSTGINEFRSGDDKIVRVSGTQDTVTQIVPGVEINMTSNEALGLMGGRVWSPKTSINDFRGGQNLNLKGWVTLELPQPQLTQGVR